MTLNDAQRKQVEENMGLVGKVIKDKVHGVTAKGIRALRLMADGYTAREIGEQMGASANNVTARVSRARRYLREIGRYCI